MDFVDKLVPTNFGYVEFENQGPMAKQNSGGAVRSREVGRFSRKTMVSLAGYNQQPARPTSPTYHFGDDNRGDINLCILMSGNHKSKSST